MRKIGKDFLLFAGNNRNFYRARAKKIIMYARKILGIRKIAISNDRRFRISKRAERLRELQRIVYENYSEIITRDYIKHIALQHNRYYQLLRERQRCYRIMQNTDSDRIRELAKQRIKQIKSEIKKLKEELEPSIFVRYQTIMNRIRKITANIEKPIDIMPTIQLEKTDTPKNWFYFEAIQKIAFEKLKRKKKKTAKELLQENEKLAKKMLRNRYMKMIEELEKEFEKHRN